MFTNDTTTESSHRIPTSLSDTGGEQDTDSLNNDEADSINQATKNEQSLRSSVWKYATKITPETARCNKCGKTMKTIYGGTSSLRKHLLHQHNIVPTPSRKSSTRPKLTSISKEKKSRLDYLLKLATFQDGRSFGDFRKSGMINFLAEAVPGKNIIRPKTSELMFDECKRSSRSEADFFNKNQSSLSGIHLSDAGEILYF
jgi:BED zinc finger